MFLLFTAKYQTLKNSIKLCLLESLNFYLCRFTFFNLHLANLVLVIPDILSNNAPTEPRRADVH